ncbi:MAG: histidine kinase [Saprospiraceae bacterium]
MSAYKWAIGMLLLVIALPATAQEFVGPYPVYRTIGPADGLPYQTATTSVEHSDGTYWIGCPVGVQRYVLGAPVKLYRFGDSLAPQTERWAHLLRSEGDSLFAYTGAQVYAYDAVSDAWHLSPSRAKLNELPAEPQLDRSVVGLSQRFLAKSLLPISLQEELPDVTFTSLLLYDEHRAFLSSPAGLFEVRKDGQGDWHSVSGRDPVGLAGIPVEGLGVDKNQNLLIGTGNYSVVVLYRYVLEGRMLSLPKGQASSAWGMAEDEEGTLWVSNRQSVCYAKKGGGPFLNPDPTFPLKAGRTVNHISYRSGELIAGASDGLYRNIKGRWQKENLPIQARNSGFIYRVNPAPDAGLDAYSVGQIMHQSPGRPWQMGYDNQAASIQYYDGLHSSDGSYWVASVRGLFRAARFGESLKQRVPFAGEAETTFPFIRALEDPQGILYFVSLDGGLWRSTNGVEVERVQGGNQVARSLYAAEVDGKGRVWMGTNNGLACYLPAEDQWRYFTPAEGYPISDHNQASSLLLASGELAFGGKEGVLVFDPEKMLSTRSISVLGLSVISLDDVGKRAQWPVPNSISYPYTTRRLDLSFALMGALDTVGKVAEFRLLEQGERWRNLRGMRLDFDGLAYGSYTLEARIRDRQTGVSGEVLRTTISRPPPWYATWWARSLFLLFAVGAVAAGITWISTVRLRRKLGKIELENRINAERVRIARDLHDNVGSTLTYLTTSLRRIKDKVPETEVQSNLKDLEELSQDTLWQLRETIWAASQRQVSLGEFAERLAAYLRRLRAVAQPTVLKAMLPTEANLKLAPGQGLYMFRIVQEALTNAIKHASAKQITVKLEQQAEVLILEILDDGVGFDESEMAYSSGVASIQERGKEMGAEVKLVTGKGKGTCWTIRFPLVNPEKINTP